LKIPAFLDIDSPSTASPRIRRLLRAALGLASVLFAAAALPPRAHAQAMPTAAKQNSISVFAAGTYSNPQYGPYYDQGITFGANIVQHLRHRIDPSIEGRVNITSGTDVGERTLLGGLRVQTSFRALHPYGDFLIGGGNIHFNLSNGQTYVTGDSTVFSYGGGLDIDVFRQYQLKLDIQQQDWKLGDAPFKPWIAAVGVTYRFHFRDYIKQGEAR
jgi:hypothetical protein